MKKKMCWLFTVVMLAFYVSGIISSYTVEAETISNTKKTIYIGIPYTWKINGKTVQGKWKSLKPEIATVTDKGKITGRKKGTTVISLTVGRKKYNCPVTVKQPVTKIVLTPEASLIDVKYKTQKITAKIYPQSADSKKLIWKSSNPKTATVSQNGVVTPVSDGYTEITATAADRKKVYGNCAIYVRNCSAPVIKKTKYKYEVYLIDGLGKDNWYVETTRPIYIKTNNPDINSIYYFVSYSVSTLVGRQEQYEDVDYVNKNAGMEVSKVEGGYLISAGFSDRKKDLFSGYGGTATMNIMENDNIVASFTCNVKDFEKESRRKIRAVLNEITTKSMTPFEKMQAVCDYFEKKNVKYFSNNGDRVVRLAADPGGPWWIKWRFDSCTTPGLLYKFAEEIGEFEKIENDYEKYWQTDQWASRHWFVEVTVGSETRRYSFCPDMETGYIKNVKKINFRDTSKFTRVY